MAELSFFDRVATHRTHVPDVLSCIANLSNDEVFTPPEVVNKMLDLLPQELFADPKTTFLDPATKTGVFLREIAKRCLDAQLPGYKDRSIEISEKKKLDLPLDEYDVAFEKQLQEKIDHIFHNQLFGIGITELTSLLARRSVYCSKWPNGPYSITHFDNSEGNILFRRTEHTWDPAKLMYDINGKKIGKCIYCGAKRDEYDRGDVLESHAYEFIHIENPEEIFKMKFDVIIGNPPYQLSDGGQGASASPIYQLFVQQAQKLQPRYLSMIIPSRWFAGGKGLDLFRKSMLNDSRISKLVDYENYKDVFPTLGGLAGGVCYFLWERDHNGTCEVINRTNTTESSMERELNEFDVFIRSNKAISILHKVLSSHKGQYLDKVVSSRKPFGLPTNYQPKEDGVPCQFIQRIGLKYADKKDITDPFDLLNKWKIIVPKAPIAGQTDFSKPVNIYYESNTKIIPPGTCCTESFIVLFAAETEEEVLSFKSYMFTKTARFLLLQSVVSQDITRERFRFVPDLGDYNTTFTDEMLIEKWGLSEEEWTLIQSRIGEQGGEE